MLFEDYYRLISIVRFQIETFTGNQWPIPDYRNVVNSVQDYDSFSLALNFGRWPGAEYIAYLRHHGFPTPFLDWTSSPFVAAYFAFHSASENAEVSIYVLSESRMQLGSSKVPRVYHLGPNIKTHRRYFLQQSTYTMCLGFNDQQKWQFVSHKSPLAFIGPEHRERPNFDLRKFNLPSSERLKVLKLLDDYNLNAFSLFASEESLMETMALREIEFEDKF